MLVQSPGGTPYNGLYGKAPPERGTFFRVEVRSELRAGANSLLVEVYKRVAISRAEV